MNTTWTDAQDWLDIVDHVWIGLVLVAVAGVPSWMSYRNHSKIKDVSDQVQGVSAQVVNGHTTPMREDVDGIRTVLDEMRDEMRGGMKAMRADLSDIRAELRQERKDRIELDDRFETFRRFKRNSR